MTNIKPYAVIFKAFTMDHFVERQLARVVAAAKSGDVYLVMDETGGDAGPIAFDRVIRYRESDVTGLGFSAHARGSLFWYNADYPLYYFQHLHDKYDYVLMLEYDAVLQIDLDMMIQACRDEEIDLVAYKIEKSLDDYWWTDSMLYFYRREEIYPVLICAAVISAKAIRHLAACRLRQGRESIDDSQWPVGEAFVGTELSAAGFKLRALSAFGLVARYDWWPPTHESELRDLPHQAFVHPVLTGRRYVSSLFKNGRITGVVAMFRLNLPRIIWRMTMRGIWKQIQGKN